MLNQVELTERRISSVVASIEQTQERVVAVVSRVSQTVTGIDVIVAEAAILTRAARALSAPRVANNDSRTSGLTFLRAKSAASCHKSFCP